MQLEFASYSHIFFDCDGVLLKSNSIKTQAFRDVALRFGEDVAERFVAYHVANGGVSRYEKFEYLRSEILGANSDIFELHDLLSDFAKFVERGLMNAELAEGLEDLKKASNAKWYVVSGGDQQELRKVFRGRKLDAFFNGGIWGSPKTKYEIIELLKAEELIEGRPLFLGDSLLDYMVAEHFDFDFCFIADWSEFKSGKEFFAQKSRPVVGKLADLLLV